MIVILLINKALKKVKSFLLNNHKLAKSRFKKNKKKKKKKKIKKKKKKKEK